MFGEWTDSLEDDYLTLFEYEVNNTKVKNKSNKTILELFPSINHTSNDKPSNTEPIYPTVYYHELPGSEVAQDFENDEINAYRFNMQIEVITNTKTADATLILNVVKHICKKLGFNIAEMPNFDNGNNYFRKIIRVNKVLTKPMQ